MTTSDAPEAVWAARYQDALNPAAYITCLHCGVRTDTRAPFWGCQVCGQNAPLKIDYADVLESECSPLAAVARARSAYSLFLPQANLTQLDAPTPLTHAPALGPNVYLKQETFSQTHSHKDRYQSIASRMARLSGAQGVVASSTGNHGVSAAAHAAMVGLPSVVFCHPDAPKGLLGAIGAFGGEVAQLTADEQRPALIALVQDGWFPATSLDPILTGAANPYAAEGYKAVAWEIVEQLAGPPDAVFIPTAGGDTYYGIAKGLAEITRLANAAMPTVYAVQPDGANALSQSLAAGQQVTLEAPESIALSIADAQSGRHALAVIAKWHGRVADVPEIAIRTAVIDLAQLGIYTDPASAAALAGYRQAVSNGELDPAAITVLLLTSSGFKWPAAMEAIFPPRSARSLAGLRARLAGR